MAAQTTPPVPQEELPALMAVNDNWSYPAEKDGWVLIHNAIRWDMRSFAEAISVTKASVKAGKALEQWQVSNMTEFFNYLHDIVHSHHDHEEDIFFPYMSKRITLPPKMTADHKTLMAMMAEVRVAINQELPAAAKDAASSAMALEKIETLFGQMRTEMESHFKEEEEVGLPLVRKYWTQKEFNNGPEKELIKHLTPADMAYLMRDIPKLEEQQAAMTMLRVPGPVQSLIMRPAIRKDQALRVRLVKELQAGERLPAEGGACQCTIM